MTYILTIEAKRKGAKRHIVKKSSDIEELRKLSNNLNDRYKVDIYNGKWQFIENIK